MFKTFIIAASLAIPGCIGFYFVLAIMLMDGSDVLLPLAFELGAGAGVICALIFTFEERDTRLP